MNMMDALNSFNSRMCEINEALPMLDDEIALTVPALFPAWAADTDYVTDQRLRYTDGKLYKVLQNHTSQSDWTPDIAVSLYVEVAEPGTIPVWKQPTGAQDAYRLGDKVHFPEENDPVYESDIDYNTYAPNVYGWHQVE